MTTFMAVLFVVALIVAVGSELLTLNIDARHRLIGSTARLLATDADNTIRQRDPKQPPLTEWENPWLRPAQALEFQRKILRSDRRLVNIIRGTACAAVVFAGGYFLMLYGM